MTFYVAPETPPPSRLPPKRSRFQISTPGVVWYRDRILLRLLSQLGFIVLFVGSIVLGINGLVGNLRESNLVIDFEVYRRPFGPAITEGPKTDTEYAWLTEPNLTGSDNWYFGFAGSFIWYAWVAIWVFVTLNYGYANRQQPQKAGLIVVVSLLFLWLQPAIFHWIIDQIGPSIAPYLAPRANTRTLITGLVNTLRVVAASVVASTLLGIFAGVGLLSRNYLLRNVSKIYVEIFRNTPLLLQLLFVYTALITVLPSVRGLPFSSPEKIGPYTLHEKIFALNAASFRFANPQTTNTWWIFLTLTVVGMVIAGYVRQWRLNQQEETGQPAQTWTYITPIILGFIVAGWLLAGGYPLSSGPFDVDYPVISRFGTEGGFNLSIAFIALTLGLTLYTAAFIADIVRAGIQSVPYGQIEAARAHGLSNSQTLNMVVLPQALRLIIPPLGNQYVNLGKNSSLAVAVAYVDLYRVADLANNESGQAVPFFLGLMLMYLGLSLTLSLLTNLLNGFTKIRTR